MLFADVVCRRFKLYTVDAEDGGMREPGLWAETLAVGIEMHTQTTVASGPVRSDRSWFVIRRGSEE